mmetsp:Transcript_97665/g.173979  ORF Transcript_97665/g.173979 Transcript_97665/m.173979 type:complete len:231 (-) Transcript_97665:208-900(-)
MHANLRFWWLPGHRRISSHADNLHLVLARRWLGAFYCRRPCLAFSNTDVLARQRAAHPHEHSVPAPPWIQGGEVSRSHVLQHALPAVRSFWQSNFSCTRSLQALCRRFYQWDGHPGCHCCLSRLRQEFEQDECKGYTCFVRAHLGSHQHLGACRCLWPFGRFLRWYATDTSSYERRSSKYPTEHCTRRFLAGRSLGALRTHYFGEAARCLFLRAVPEHCSCLCKDILASN